MSRYVAYYDDARGVPLFGEDEFLYFSVGYNRMINEQSIPPVKHGTTVFSSRRVKR